MKEIRKMKNKPLANYIRLLQHKGRIKTYLSESGYIAYDPEEYATFKKNAKRGRPPKIQIYKGE